MATLRKLTLDFNERKDRWDLTDDKTDRVIKTFDTKGDATKRGVLRRLALGRGFLPAHLVPQARSA